MLIAAWFEGGGDHQGNVKIKCGITINSNGVSLCVATWMDFKILGDIKNGND